MYNDNNGYYYFEEWDRHHRRAPFIPNVRITLANDRSSCIVLVVFRSFLLIFTYMLIYICIGVPSLSLFEYRKGLGGTLFYKEAR